MQQPSAGLGRLTARPLQEVTDPAPVGRVPLGPGGRDGLLFVPKSYDGAHTAPLLVALHGAGGNPMRAFSWVLEASEAFGFLVLMPQAIGRTWDILGGAFGQDVQLIDAVLGAVFAHYRIDPDLVAICGFSDGASYALSLGLTNGDLFSAILAFSPGFSHPGEPHGKPAVFISHGTDDRVLSIDACSRRIVPPLARSGYAVHYAEFEGGHAIPPPIMQMALEWLTGRPSGGEPAG